MSRRPVNQPSDAEEDCLQKQRQRTGGRMFLRYALLLFASLVVLSTQSHATLRKTWFSVEVEWTAAMVWAVSDWLREHWYLFVLIVVAYLVLVFGGIRVMQTREAFDLKYALAAWSFSLAFFSFIGSIRTVPWLVQSLLVHGFDYTVCGDATVTYGSGGV